MTLAGAILAPRWSYMDASIAFNANTSFLTVIMALLGGAASVWGPMLGVVPLVLISDYLSVTVPSYFSVVLGGVLLAVVFAVPNGLIGLLAPAAPLVQRERLARLLRGLAARIDGGSRERRGAAMASPPVEPQVLAPDKRQA
jgi:branched-chain amino acid transport system permease protein